MIRTDSTLSDSAGFNTNGWHKSLITVPPTDRPDDLGLPYRGTYVRCGWLGFVYLPGLDSPGHDIRQLPNNRVLELIRAARNDPTVVAVNTAGWLKNNLLDEPHDTGNADRLQGIYVKDVDLLIRTIDVTQSGTRAIDENILVQAALFALNGTVVIWSVWLFRDHQVRQAYRNAVNAGANEIKKKVADEDWNAERAVHAAVRMRNNYLDHMRNRTSSLGLLIARQIKPAGGDARQYLNKYAQRRYRIDFNQISNEDTVRRNQVRFKP